MNEGNCDDNHNQTVAVPIQSVKTARPSLAKIILSQESDTAKQQALNHILTALQIIYARYGIFMVNSHNVRRQGVHQTVQLYFFNLLQFFFSILCYWFVILVHQQIFCKTNFP